MDKDSIAVIAANANRDVRGTAGPSDPNDLKCDFFSIGSIKSDEDRDRSADNRMDTSQHVERI